MTDVWIDYENHRGVRRWRQVTPVAGTLRFTATPYHPEAQWVFDAHDVTPEAFSGTLPRGLRSFALASVFAWSAEAPGPRTARVEAP